MAGEFGNWKTGRVGGNVSALERANETEPVVTREFTVLGTPLLATSYEELAAQCRDWARGPKCVSMEFANTQIVAMRRHEPWFRELTSAYDYFIPDGMPLVWCLNRAGAGLKDRVYGPTFMREFLTHAPAGSTHYLLGGSEECGARLRERLLKLNPDLRFVGSFHGKCGVDGLLEGDAEAAVHGGFEREIAGFHLGRFRHAQTTGVAETASGT